MNKAARGSTPPAFAQENADAFRTSLLSYADKDAYEKCAAKMAVFTSMGGAQDDAVAACRMIVKTLRQRAGIAMAVNPELKEVTTEIRQRTQVMLRKATAYERLVTRRRVPQVAVLRDLCLRFNRRHRSRKYRDLWHPRSTQSRDKPPSEERIIHDAPGQFQIPFRQRMARVGIQLTWQHLRHEMGDAVLRQPAFGRLVASRCIARAAPGRSGCWLNGPTITRTGRCHERGGGRLRV